MNILRKLKKNFQSLMKKLNAMIRRWIEKNLKDCENPRLYGKALHGKLREKWRYRVGDYRIISEIKDDKIKILIVDVSHRRNVTNKKEEIF